MSSFKILHQAAIVLHAQITNRIGECPFHLSPCGSCGSPTWQQPCHVCGYYPQGNPVAAGDESNHVTFETFNRRTGHNILTKWTEDWRKTVAYRDSPEFAKRVEVAIETAAQVKDIPSNEQVWNKKRSRHTIIHNAS
jgi:hypothetical protein